MSLGDQIRVPARAARPERRPRGRVWLYAVAFVMLLVAGWLQVMGNFNSNLRQVRWSIALSVAAVAVAVASVVVPARRRRPATGAEQQNASPAAGPEREPTDGAKPREVGTAEADPGDPAESRPGETGERPPSAS